MRYIFISLAVVLVSCRKSTIDFPDSKSQELIGKWEWVESVGGWLDQSAAFGNQQKIEFDEYGVYKAFKNGVRKTKTEYKVSWSNSPHMNSQYLVEYESSGIREHPKIE
ncbi:MAG: hypothetical protein JKY42_03275 [Flavobacteriales bacterium]|nr:hypothetical protein [Flavobacteriales bacterium]